MCDGCRNSPCTPWLLEAWVMTIREGNSRTVMRKTWYARYVPVTEHVHGVESCGRGAHLVTGKRCHEIIAVDGTGVVMAPDT